MSGSGKNGGNVKGKPAKPNAGGQKPRGRPFKVGNPGGPGNPWPKLTQALKRAIADASDEPHEEHKTRARALAEQLWKMALGEISFPEDKTGAARRWAIKEVLDRALGKPKEHLELTGDFTLTEFYRALGSHLRTA